MSSKADPIQIARMVFDEEAEANRVTMVNTELAIELDAADGDSVIAISQMTVHDLKAGDILETSTARRMTCFPIKTIKAVIMEQEIDLGQIGHSPVDICVPAIKVEEDCIIVLQG